MIQPRGDVERIVGRRGAQLDEALERARRAVADATHEVDARHGPLFPGSG
jgi:hypothetical protein